MTWMVYVVLALNIIATVAAIAFVQRRSPAHLHLLTLVLASLFLAYPAKCALLLLDYEAYITFAHHQDLLGYFLINVVYFANVLALVVAAALFMPRERRELAAPDGFLHPTLWLLAISAILIVAYGDIYTEYYTDFSLVANELRRKSLEAQVGYGWITVLMLAGLPFVYFTLRSNASRLARLVAVAAFLSVLLVVGSRAYILGAVLLAAAAAIGFSPVRSGIVLGVLAGAGALYGMINWGERPDFFVSFAVSRFMHTFDGFDLFAAYLQAERTLLWGATIIEDIFITYVPRVLWESKPFLFGSNEIVATMFPQLADTRGIMATFPSGFLLEQYANFSFFGVALGFLLFALLTRYPRTDRFRGRSVYLGLFAFAPTFFRSGASFVTLLLLLTLLAFFIDGLERAIAAVSRLLSAGLRVRELKAQRSSRRTPSRPPQTSTEPAPADER